MITKEKFEKYKKQIDILNKINAGFFVVWVLVMIAALIVPPTASKIVLVIGGGLAGAGIITFAFILNNMEKEVLSK